MNILEGLHKVLRTYIALNILLLGSYVKISTTISVSCHISGNTVEVVDDCPDSEEKWRKAGARKNCTAYASQCDKPHQLVYHCVINSYKNETLELCAYGKYILSGYCTEYSLLGNRIQQNLRTNCTQFNENPCPIAYHSTEAYKYPGCYKLTKKMATQPISNPKKGGITRISNLPAHGYDKAETRNVSNMSDMERPADKEGTNNNVNITYWLVPLVIFIVAVAFGLAYVMSTKRKKSHGDNPGDNAATMPLDPIT